MAKLCSRRSQPQRRHAAAAWLSSESSAIRPYVRRWHVTMIYNTHIIKRHFRKHVQMCRLLNTTQHMLKNTGLMHLDWTHHDHLSAHVPSRTLVSLLQHQSHLPESDSALYQYTSLIAFPFLLRQGAWCIDSVRYQLLVGRVIDDEDLTNAVVSTGVSLAGK